MQSLSKIILVLLVLRFPGFAETPKSFFMNDEDSQKAISMAKQKSKSEESACEGIKLSGIFFIDESNWTVWINGTPYSSIGQQEDFSIDEVSEDSVLITTSEGNTIKLSVRC